MIEIRIDTDDVKTKRMISKLEKLDETLSDEWSKAIVTEARKHAPIHLRTNIHRRKQGKTWIIEAKVASMGIYISDALQTIKWSQIYSHVTRWLSR